MEGPSKDKKVFVNVLVSFDTTGQMRPVMIEWGDGEKFEIDRVIAVVRQASLKAGGFGTRYTIRIHGKETYLWHEPYQGIHDCGKWFVEAK